MKRTRFTTLRRLSGWALVGVIAAGAAGCGDILDVEDPASFGDEDLDNPAVLPNVANGVEGNFQQNIDEVIVFTGLMSDELEDTSTWIDWADLSLGRIRGDWPSTPHLSTIMNNLLRTRYAAQDAAERFVRVLGEGEANTSPLMAKVRTTEAWTDLILGMNWCEAPLIEGGPRATDDEVLAQALTKFNNALTVAQAAGEAEWVNWAMAGRARTNLLLGNYDAALADARAVPEGYQKNAIYSVGVATHWPGEQLHQNRNRSGSLRSIWWPMVDTSNNALVPTPTQFVRDPYTNLPDPRIAVLHPAGRIGVNNRTLHYSIQKYADRASPIRIASKREMNLIEAEVLWRKGDFQGAIDAMNRNRTTVQPGAVAGAPAPLPAFTKDGAWTSEEVFDRLLSERFAELFVEGHRMADLERFGLVTERLGTGRATKFMLSRTEIQNNPNMQEGEATCPNLS